MHVVGDHEAGDLFLRHDALGQLQHFLGGGRVQGGGVLVQQEELGGDERCHQQGQRLPLAAGKQAHRLLHPVFQPHVEQGQLLTEDLFVLAGDAGEDGVGRGSCPQVSQRQIFFNGHIGGRALERVLEQVADDLAALVFRRKRDVLPAQINAAFIRNEAAGDGVEEGGFTGAVGAHDGGKIACFHLQAHPVEGHFFIDGAGVERLVEVLQFQHFHLRPPPFSVPHVSAFQRRSVPGWRASRWPRPR